MPRSQNGWTASPNAADLHIAPLVVGGVNFSPGVAHHDHAAVVLDYFWTQFHLRVEKLRKGWCWGYYYRANRNDPNSLSNHSSGTAGDGNAPLHPNGVPTSKTFSARQIAEVHRILAELNSTEYGVVFRWGGDYTHTPDSMHGEIVGSVHAVNGVGDMIVRGKITPGKRPVVAVITPTPSARKARKAVRTATGAKVVNVNAIQRLAKINDDVRDVQRVLNAWFPHSDLAVDGLYGDASYIALEAARKHFQIAGHVSDVAVRAHVLRKLGLKVVRK